MDSKHAGHSSPRPLFDPPIVRRALVDAFRKLDPRQMVKNPVMFVVAVGAMFVTGIVLRDAAGRRRLSGLPSPDRPVAVVHCALRQLRRSHGRGPRQSPGR